jgi:transposase-like protein
MNVMAKSTEVSSKATRRRFPTSEKIRILHEADACTEKGEIGALMRREGIYSSHLSTWRAQRAAGQFGGSPRKRGPVPTSADSRDKLLRAPVVNVGRSLEGDAAVVVLVIIVDS